MSTPTELERVVEAIGIATYGGRSFEATGVYRDKLEKIVTTYAKTVAEEAVRVERERIRIELGQKLTCSLYYQGSPIINEKDVEKALTPLPDKE